VCSREIWRRASATDGAAAVLDAWIAKQDEKPSRPEVIRRLMALGLADEMINGSKLGRKKK
jgi:hypothetical protein